jgi:predicted nucleotidyltransferase
MTELERIQQQKKNILAIARQHGIVRLRLFGSIVRGEETPQSDIDLLVDLEPGRSMFDLGGALIQLQELLRRKVDIVTEGGLHWYLKEKIMQEAVPL